MPHDLIVGAGFAGAVHARVLAEAGRDITLLDRRPHVAGNAFDLLDGNGIRIHQYGPHLFHTSNNKVVAWVRRFARWLPYEHRVRARLPDGGAVPLPVNRDTINRVFGLSLQTPDAVEAFLASVAVQGGRPPANAAEYLYSRIGIRLTELFFRPYTQKMWAMALEEMDQSVVQRIPLRLDAEDRYFPEDAFQALPEGGYTRLVEAMLDHPRIRVSTGQEFRPGMEAGFDHCFNSMPIDEFFGQALGELPYRSIRFHHRSVRAGAPDGWATTNFTDAGPLTRETRWDLLPGHLLADNGQRSITAEEPCDYRDNGLERYYPVKTADGRYQARYAAYRALAAASVPRMHFIGRCGTYQYLNMDQVINQSLLGAARFLAEQG